MPKKITTIGLQPGDEGKAKVANKITSLAVEMVGEIPDFLSRGVIVERSGGGPNAGHTLVINGNIIKLHQVPCGITVPGTYNLLGEGMYINPRKLMAEIRLLQQSGFPVHQWNVGVAANAQVILDYHAQADQVSFRKKDHTSTGNGITQVAVDKYGKRGIRFIEFLDRNLMVDILWDNFPKGMKGRTYWSLADSYAQEREFLRQFVIDPIAARKTHGTHYWIGEGAQGALLDIDVGQYPGVTSSHPAHVRNSTDIILGVVKLYCSSVGTGNGAREGRAFMSRMDRGLESVLRSAWGEFGSTTGKKRELGWFDAVAVKYAAEATSTNYLVGTCGDRLEELQKMNESVRLVTGYRIGKKVYREWDASFHRRDVLREVEPVFEEFWPWQHFTELDGTIGSEARRYIDRIQELTGKEFVMLGTGPAQDDVIMYKNVLEL